MRQCLNGVAVSTLLPGCQAIDHISEVHDNIMLSSVCRPVKARRNLFWMGQNLVEGVDLVLLSLFYLFHHSYQRYRLPYKQGPMCPDIPSGRHELAQLDIGSCHRQIAYVAHLTILLVVLCSAHFSLLSLATCAVHSLVVSKAKASSGAWLSHWGRL